MPDLILLASATLACVSMAAAQPPMYTMQVIGGFEQPANSGPVSLPLGLNNNGRLVGYGTTPATQSSILNWKGGALSNTAPAQGLNRTFGSRVNILGRIAGGGFVTDANGAILQSRAVRWKALQPLDLGTLGGNNALAMGIDDNDRIVGYSTLAGEAQTRAFVWQNGVMTALAAPGNATESYAYDISNTGYIVGVALGPNPAKPYVWRNGTVTTLPIPSSSRTGGANAVNDAGESVGTYEISQTAGTFMAVRWKNGQRVDLGSLGGSYVYSTANDINNFGDIVGTSNSAAGYTGYLYRNGVMYDLRSLVIGTSVVITSAQAINDNGQIAAGAVINGRLTAVLLTPVGAGTPTPGSSAAFLGAGVLLARRRRRA